MSSRYVLILVSLNPDRTDLSGNRYPDCGYVQAKNYRPDSNIQYGLYGTLWGKTNHDRWVNKDPEAEWLVVKTENNDELLPLDKSSHFVKFRSGMVVFSGNRESCEAYINANMPSEPLLTPARQLQPIPLPCQSVQPVESPALSPASCLPQDSFLRLAGESVTGQQGSSQDS